MPRRELLTEPQRLTFTQPATDEREMVRHYTLSGEDRGLIDHRRDQKLACDALAAAIDGDHRVQTAELLLRTQAMSEGSTSPPLGASWHPVNPRIERLAALRRTRPSAARSAIGKAAIVLTLMSLTLGSWTSRAATAAISGGLPIALAINWTVMRAPAGTAATSSTEKSTLVTEAVVLSGQSMQVFLAAPNGEHRYDLLCKAKVMESPETGKPDGQLLIECMVRRHDGVPIAAPAIITADNEDAAVEASGKDDDGEPVVMRWTINASTQDWRIKRAHSAQKMISGG